MLKSIKTIILVSALAGAGPAVVSPANAAVRSFAGSFSVAGATGPVSSWGGTFRFTFDTMAIPVADFTPDAFALTIGTDAFDASNTRVDTATPPLSEGARDFIIGRFGSAPGDTNNTITGPSDFRFRVSLDNNDQLVSARGVYRTATNQIGSFDTTLGDGSSATFVIAAVPEPSTWAAMIMGFALAGACARARRTHLQRTG